MMRNFDLIRRTSTMSLTLYFSFIVARTTLQCRKLIVFALFLLYRFDFYNFKSLIKEKNASVGAAKKQLVRSSAIAVASGDS